MPLFTGTFTGATGACPVCGASVGRVHAFNGAKVIDSYACLRCGPTVYASAFSPALS